MAVKKANKATEDVKVETPVEVETLEVEVEAVETPVEEQVEVEDTVETPEVEIPEVDVEEKKDEPKVEVDQTAPDTANRPNGKVKIRMRVDHKCTIAMERYDLKAGKTYTVPENVKRILNNAGLLAPL